MGQPFLFDLIDKAVIDYNLIEDGDKILVASSGGKDSTALVHYFAMRSRRPNANFTWDAFHVQTEITPPLPSALVSLFEKWGVKPINQFVQVLGRLKDGNKMNCWWCSTQRRSELLKYAIKNGYTKIALGHHMDDILETLLMNMLHKAKLSAMPARFKYDKYPMKVIRPLCYATEDTIIEHAKQFEYISMTCTCSYQDNSARKEARRLLENLTDGKKKSKEKLFWSLKNIDARYLP